MLKVSEVAKKLNVSQVTIYKKLKHLKKELKTNIVKRNGATYLTEKGFNLIKQTLNPLKIKQDKSGNDQEFNQLENVKKSLNEDLIESYKNQIDYLKIELTRKDNLLNQLIENSSKERERTDTIIMKLTQDLEKIRSENQLLLETAKKKKDRVVSIEEYINKKIEEDIEKSNYQKEKKRLKNKYSDPLQGKSKLY